MRSSGGSASSCVSAESTLASNPASVAVLVVPISASSIPSAAPALPVSSRTTSRSAVDVSSMVRCRRAGGTGGMIR
eukprot:243-Prymnesium_polylepis.1